MSLKPKPESKSYLVDTFNAFSPWSSRPATPRLGDEEPGKESNQETATASNSQATKVPDHKLNPRKKINLKDYPKDCPPLNIQWYHAVDVAKKKPHYAKPAIKEEKPLPPPKKWNAFSSQDSHAIEATFQDLPEAAEEHSDGTEGSHGATQHAAVDTKVHEGAKPRSDDEPNTSLEALPDSDSSASVKVPVNEDFLFDVDIDNRELAPAYWLGPIYEVRRGSWFYTDGNTLRPCDENLAYQIEEGYLKTTPWRRTASEKSATIADLKEHGSGQTTPTGADSCAPKIDESSIAKQPTSDEKVLNLGTQNGPVAYRLFGAHMNTVVQYIDGETAYLLTDDFYSRMTSTVYQRFAGGAHLSGTKVVRGFSDLSRKRSAKAAKRSTTPAVSSTTPERSRNVSRRRAASAERRLDVSRGREPRVLNSDANGQSTEMEDAEPPELETTVSRLERKMTSLLASAAPDDPSKQDEEAQKLEEQEISDDYRDTSGEQQDRDIEHLILITHGIGQRLGQRFETFNFIHDVNEFRKLLKAVYNGSPDLQALNAEIDTLPKNCRIQVLPICWRHKLDFPHQSLKHNRKEYDLADEEEEGDDAKYPTLHEITVEGVPAVRNIIADLALDILLYQTPLYKGHISKIVADECNRVYKLFKERNPSFQGKISLCGHSLGSAIFFDIASDQPDDLPFLDKIQKRQRIQKATKFKLDFEVENLFMLGSPVGLFQMLQGKTLEGRRNPNEVTLDGSVDGIDNMHNDERPKYAQRQGSFSQSTIVSSPKTRQLYNIFHPTDPIAYRIEPLITPSMTKLKPQSLPYVKKGFLNAPVGQGLTAIPALVGQSVSGFWSNISSGLTDRFITRSLGISAENAAKLIMPLSPVESRNPIAFSPGAGTNIVAGGVISDQTGRKLSLTEHTISPLDADSEGGQRHPPTLVDNELETLFTGFQKARDSTEEVRDKSDGAERKQSWVAIEEHDVHLRKEEAKVKTLNSLGRVDYQIQEGAFDISFLGSLASHLAYWTDEDVGHFVASQLLSRQRIITARHSKSRSIG